MMTNWGKSALYGSGWKHRHSISTSELDKNRNKYKKMNDEYEFGTSFFDKNDNNNISNNIINNNNSNNSQINSKRRNSSFIIRNRSRRSNSNSSSSHSNINSNSNSNNNNNQEKWLSTSFNSNYSFNSDISSHSNNESLTTSLPIKEKDVMEWKRYANHEIADTDYINLNINELLKEFVNKNMISSQNKNAVLSPIQENNTYNSNAENNNDDTTTSASTSTTSNLNSVVIPNNKNNTINNNIKINTNTINTNTNTNTNNNSINYQKNYNTNVNDITNTSIDNDVEDERFVINENNNTKSNNRKSSLSDYDIQTIEYNLKYNSNYEIEDIPEEIIMELLNHQLQSKEETEHSKSLFNKSPSLIPSTLVSVSSYSNNSNNNNNDNYINVNNSNNGNNQSYNNNNFDGSLKEDTSSYNSETSSNITHPPSITKPEINWNSLYIIQELSNLSEYSNCGPDYYSNLYSSGVDNNNNNNNNNNRKNSNSNSTTIYSSGSSTTSSISNSSNNGNGNKDKNPFDYNYNYNYNYCISSDYHQFYLDNRPPETPPPQHSKRRNSLKDVIKGSYKHIRKTIKIKPRKSSTSNSSSSTGNSTIYTLNENSEDTTFTEIISFNDALNLPIEKNSK